MPVIESESKIVTGIGETVGAGIGTNVDVEIGTLVDGYVVGVEIVGCGFGKADGACKAIVGATLGTAVGAALTLGKAVGAYDGNGVGTDETVGAGIGTALGAAVGAYDGNGVGAGVGAGVSVSRCRCMPCAIAPSIGSIGCEYAPLTATRSTEMRSILEPVCVDGNRVTVTNM